MVRKKKTRERLKIIFEIKRKTLSPGANRWERTHPCVLDAKAFKKPRWEFKLIQCGGLYAAKRDVAHKDACAPSKDAIARSHHQIETVKGEIQVGKEKKKNLCERLEIIIVFMA